jgi:3,4-dihydroxy 2-butanone 4-phosphate synthase/GTP cyclohydrolase II
MAILTNNPKKMHGLAGYGLELVDQRPLTTPPHAHNRRYLETKREKLGHLLDELAARPPSEPSEGQVGRPG